MKTVCLSNYRRKSPMQDMPHDNDFLACDLRRILWDCALSVQLRSILPRTIFLRQTVSVVYIVMPLWCELKMQEDIFPLSLLENLPKVYLCGPNLMIEYLASLLAMSCIVSGDPDAARPGPEPSLSATSIASRRFGLAGPKPGGCYRY